MAISEDTGDGLAFEESSARGETGIDEDVRAEPPDEERIAWSRKGAKLFSRLLAVPIHTKVARILKPEILRPEPHHRHQQQRPHDNVGQPVLAASRPSGRLSFTPSPRRRDRERRQQ